LVIKVEDISGIKAHTNGRAITLTQFITSSPAKTIEGLPIYEGTERVLQHILGSQFPFYSEKLGRLDTIYNQDGDVYLSEDQKTFIHMLGGLNFRGSQISDPNAPIPASFEDIFQSLTSMYNLGYTFELRDGFFRLRIEDYSFFFDDDVSLDLSDQLTDLDIEGEAMPELAYLNIDTGYKKYEYLQLNGRGEFNTSSSRTSIIQTDTKFNNVSVARGDTKGMFDLLANPLDSTGSTDVRGDNDLFFLKTQRDTGGWKPEAQENIEIISGSLFGDSTYNLFLTGTRNLKRQGNRLKSSLIKFTASFLRFQVSDKLQTLRTTGTAQSGDDQYAITENEDILVDDLEDPIFRPFKLTTKTKLTYTQRKALLDNPLKRVIFTENRSGWILNYKRQNATDEVELSIIEKYVN
jgi:hypothetical protein